MTQIYSTLFIGAPVPLGTPVEYTVPEGLIAVVRDIVVVSTTNVDASVQVIVPGVRYIALLNYSAGGDSAHWAGRQVVNGGETLAAYPFIGSDCFIAISGYLLAA